MVLITVDLLKKHSEHHEGSLSNLREIALHQQGIEKIEVINQACRQLTRLYLHNNDICKIENLNRLKELQYLNLALNKITRIEGLGRCESLRKLDLTLNRIPIGALITVTTLQPCYDLQDLRLLGNPCTQWEGCRDYVISCLPQLKSLDGKEIGTDERMRALKNFEHLKQEIEGISFPFDSYFHFSTEQKPENNDVAHTCPVYSQAFKPNRKAKKQDVHSNGTIKEGEEEKEEGGDETLQCNQGDWQFTLVEGDDGNGYDHTVGGGRYRNFTRPQSLVLSIQLEPHLHLHLMKLDIQPRLVRLTVRGKLFQLRLPDDINCEAASATRSIATGKLVIRMPLSVTHIISRTNNKIDEEKLKINESLSRREAESSNISRMTLSPHRHHQLPPVPF